ncbi:MAG: hypothetical protein E6K57_02490 [Nitrospirae bacterium]|nr:MAG: hypothetical protein E6K57_02490 [Nitrospirota bacterium]
MVSTLTRKVSRLVDRLFKKKATPQKIGLSFVEMIIKSREPKRETNGTLSALSEKDRERVQLETMLLQGFVIEYVTSELFRDRPERLGILNAYYAVLDDLAKQDPVWRSFDNELRNRTVLYSQAVTAPSLDVLLTRVGDAFADACGDAGNALFSMIGIIEFEMQYVATCKLCIEYVGAFG